MVPICQAASVNAISAMDLEAVPGANKQEYPQSKHEKKIANHITLTDKLF